MKAPNPKGTFLIIVRSIISCAKNGEWIFAEEHIYRASQMDLDIEDRMILDEFSRAVGSKDWRQVDAIYKNTYGSKSWKPDLVPQNKLLAIFGFSASAFVISILAVFMVYGGLNLLDIVICFAGAMVLNILLTALLYLFKLDAQGTLVNVILIILTSVFIPFLIWLVNHLVNNHSIIGK